jgi:hypothetical protein
MRYRWSQRPDGFSNPLYSTKAHVEFSSYCRIDLIYDNISPWDTCSSTPVSDLVWAPACDLGSPFYLPKNDSSEYWLNILHSFEAHQRTMRQAAAYLNKQQLQYMAVECEKIASMSQVQTARWSSRMATSTDRIPSDRSNTIVHK